MAEVLKMNASGGLFLEKDVSILIYPSATDDWAFLDEKLPVHPSEAKLRFLMVGAFPELIYDEPIDHLVGTIDRNTSNTEAITPTTSVKDGESGINAIFRVMYHIEYSRLAAPTTLAKTSDMQNFFLIFPASKDKERDIVIQFLEHNKASNIFIFDIKGAWEYFSTRVDAGVILVSLPIPCHTQEGR